MKINFEFDTANMEKEELQEKALELQKIQKFITDKLNKIKNDKLDEYIKKFDEERNFREWGVGV